MEEPDDPPYQVKELICHYLPLDDLRSARLTSSEWCKAASCTVTTAVVEAHDAEYGSWSSVLEATTAVYPCCTCIVVLPQFDGYTSSSRGQLAEEPMAMFIADTSAQSEPLAGWQPKRWRCVLKPHPAHPCCTNPFMVGNMATRQLLHLYSMEHERVEGLLLSRHEPHIGKQAPVPFGVSSHVTCLQFAVKGPVSRVCSTNLNKRVYPELQRLFIHSTDTRLRMDARVLDCPRLTELELSGNIYLKAPHQLATRRLSSLTLPQTLQPAEVHKVLTEHPNLQHLAVVVAEPEQFQLDLFRSSAMALKRLQIKVSLLMGEGAANSSRVELDAPEPTSCSLNAANSITAHAFSHPRQQTPETIALSLIPPKRRPAGGDASACTYMQHSPGRSAAGSTAAAPPSPPAARRPHAPPAAHTAAEATAQHSGVRPVLDRCLKELTVACGSRPDLQQLLQLCRVAQLSVSTLPAVADLVPQHDQHAPSEDLSVLWSQSAAACLFGSVPAPLRLQLPQGCTLCVLDVDTSRTSAGIEVDDRALLAITSCCPFLRCLKITALLRFGQNAGASLRTMEQLQELHLCDTREQAVQHLLKLAAAAPEDDQEEMRHVMRRLLDCAYYIVSIAAFVVSDLLKHHKLYKRGALLAIHALALPTTAALTSCLVPEQHWKAALLCSSAVRLAGRAPFILRPCWLPPTLQLLHLEGCAVKSHKRCRSCSSRQDGIAGLQLPQRSAGHASCSAGASSSAGSDGRRLLADVRREIRAGRKLGVFPRLSGLVSQVLLRPFVPFVVTVFARAGVKWALRQQFAHRPALIARPAPGKGK